MSAKEMVEYIKHHLPIIIKYENDSWCNANISLENGTVIIKPDYDTPFDN